jgi:hypothetical protein
VTVFAGTVDLPVRPANAAGAMLSTMSVAVTASPENSTVIGPGLVRLDRLGLELGTDSSFKCDLAGDDPLSARVETRRSQTIARDEWRVRIETHMRLSCTHDAFLLRATPRACEGDNAVCQREWNCEIPRD